MAKKKAAKKPTKKARAKMKAPALSPKQLKALQKANVTPAAFSDEKAIAKAMQEAKPAKARATTPKATQPVKGVLQPDSESAQISRRLEEVMGMIPCPIAGCWPLHGAKTVYYFDHDCECHILEVWPLGFGEPVQHGHNGHPPTCDAICYECAEFDFTDLVKEVTLENFHFSQQRQVFEIGWKEAEQDLELRIHIVPEELDEEQ